MELNGSKAIISGGLGDIGCAVAVELASRGADIGTCDIHDEVKSVALAEQIEKLGRKFCYHRVDISRFSEVEQWILDVHGKLGTPNLIIANAGIAKFSTMRQVAADEWDQHIQVNLNGAFYMARTAANLLVAGKKTGRIVLVGSPAADFAQTKIAAYCASKAGISSLCRCLAAEYAADGILINEIRPGMVDAGVSAAEFRRNPGLREQVIEQMPVKYLIKPEEVACQIAHLCHPTNRHMTGSILTMDGGLSLHP